jgi:hypothetical protein
MRNQKWRRKKLLRKLGEPVFLSPQRLARRKKAAQSFDERMKEEKELLRLRLKAKETPSVE